MTTLVPPNYVEHVHKLALGVEPVDAMLGTRISDPLRVTLDGVPFPKPPWGSTPSAHWFEHANPLPALSRKSSCLYSLLDGPGVKSPVAVRIFDAARRFVPRRLRVALGPGNVSTVQPHLFPGAAYGVSCTTTGLRGRVLFANTTTPFRWARVVAQLPGAPTVVGRAHGDDRGEFLLLLSSAALGIGQISNPISIEIRVFGRPSPQPPPPDPKLPSQDPLWDLPLEDVPPAAALTGEETPDQYVELPTSDGVSPFESPRVVDFVPGVLRTDEPAFFVQ